MWFGFLFVQCENFGSSVKLISLALKLVYQCYLFLFSNNSNTIFSTVLFSESELNSLDIFLSQNMPL